MFKPVRGCVLYCDVCDLFDVTDGCVCCYIFGFVIHFYHVSLNSFVNSSITFFNNSCILILALFIALLIFDHV